MATDYQLRDEHFLVLESHWQQLRAGPADPSKSPDNILTIPCSPFAHGRIADWSGLESIWKQALASLKVNLARNHSPVLLSIPSTLSRNERESIVQIFFEKFNVPGLYVAEHPLMALYGYGQRLTGLVVDMAHDSVVITPIVDACVQTSAIVQLEYGHDMLVDYFVRLLKADASFVQNSVITRDQAAELFGACAHASASSFELRRGGGSGDREFVKFDGVVGGVQYSVGEPRFKAVECLFSPRMLASAPTSASHHDRSLQEAILTAVAECHVDKRASILDHIILTGPLASIRGLAERLAKEIVKLMPQTEFASELQPRSVGFAKMPDYLEEYKGKSVYAPFLGGIVTSKLIFADTKNYLSKLDYNETGPAILRTKGY